MKYLRKMIDLAFLLGILAFLLLGLGRTLLRPRKINTYENRYANTVSTPSLSAIADGSFQTSVEDALADQVLLSQTLKEKYNQINTSFQVKTTASFVASHPDRYIRLLGLKTFGGEHLVFDTRSLPQMKDKLDARIENLNDIMARHPDVAFYTYYIEKDTDINFETNQQVGAEEYLARRLSLTADRFAYFGVDSFAAFHKYFYQTDHHWNCDGSYLGYTQVLSLLEPNASPLAPVGDKVYIGTFSGSKAGITGAKEIFEEPFYAYQYDYPQMDITADGKAVADYGNQQAFFDRTASGGLSYGVFYGGDLGEVVFDTHRPERDNLLIIGESFDNAVLKLLASHFDRTYSVDLRYYAVSNGEFHLADYLKEHDISRVLFMGNIDYFVSDDFAVED